MINPRLIDVLNSIEKRGIDFIRNKSLRTKQREVSVSWPIEWNPRAHPQSQFAHDSIQTCVVLTIICQDSPWDYDLSGQERGKGKKDEKKEERRKR